MALIQCPECGQTISDKAEKCPKCGYSIVREEKETVAEAKTTMSDQPFTTSKPKRKNIVIAGVFALIAIIGVAGFLIKGVFSSVSVAEINITKWKVTDSTSYGDYYEATITSEQKKPFMAVIGSYKDEGSYPKFAFVDGGEGKLEIYTSDDDDPSIKYHPIGYYQTEKIKSSDLSIKYKDRDYYDRSYSEETHCDVDIELKVNKSITGILFVNIENITNDETDYNLSIPIINGKGKYSYYAELPYKSRGIEIEVSPVCFVKSVPLAETDYTVDKAFSVKKKVGEYSTYYDGEGTWTFSEQEDGLILYTIELTDGGDKAKRGKEENRLTFLHDHEITITSYDSVKDGILMPKYSVKLIGYLPWNEITKE